MKQIQFQHKNGATKMIPGVIRHEDLSPKMATQTERGENGVTVTVLRQVPHVVRINLLPEEPQDLSDAQKKMSKGLQAKLVERNEEIALANIDANSRVIAAIRDHEAKGGVHHVEIKDVTDAEIIAQEAVSVDISEIALADYAARGIPVPEFIRSANPERIAAFERQRQVEEKSADAARAAAAKNAADAAKTNDTAE